MSPFKIRQLLYSFSVGLSLLISLPAHAVIAPNSTSSNQISTNNNDTLTLNHALAAGTNRKLIVTVGIEDGNAANTEVDTVTFGGKALTRAGNIRATTTFTQNVEVWYLDEADINASTGNLITIITKGNVDDISGGAIILNDAYQGAPPVVTNSNSNTDFISTTTNITPPAGSWVMDAIGSGNRDPSFTSGTSQNQLWNERNSSSRFKASYKDNISANTTMTQDQNNANRLAHIVITIPPFSTVFPPPPPPPPTQSCTSTTLPVNGQDVNAISGSSDINIIVVSDSTGGGGGTGQISIFNGGTWEAQTDSDIPNEDFNDVFVFGVSSAIVVGDKGAITMLVGPPSDWIDISIDTGGDDFETVWAYSPTDIYVAGEDGRIYYWDGTYSGTSPNWVSIGTNSNNDDFVDSWGDANYVYFLDDDGEIFRYKRSSSPPSLETGTNPITPNCTGNIDYNGFTSDGATPPNFYLFGENRSPNPDEGVIFKWNGVNAWTTNTCTNVFQTSSTDDINAVNINPDGSFTAVGDDGVVVTSLNGAAGNWTEISSGGEDINAVYTSPNGNTFLGADNGSNQICTVDKPHFSIIHDGAASTCTAETIRIQFHDASHAIGTNYTGTINISTSSGNGTWSLLTGSNTASFTDNGNGSASYTFVAGDNDEIELSLLNSTPEILNLNITDGAYIEFITEDNNITFSGITATTTYEDQFNTAAYNNSDGSTSWTTSWSESNDDGLPGTGDLTITNNTFRLEGNDDDGGDAIIKSLTRIVDLSDAISATLQFDYQRQSLENNNDEVRLETSTNGANWTRLDRFRGSSDASFVTSPVYTLPISAATYIRFINRRGLDNNDFVYFDNIKITATIPAACSTTLDHIRIEHDGEGLTCDGEQVTVRACEDTNCTTEYTTSSVTATLTPDGDTITFTGNTTAKVRKSTLGSVALGATITSTPSPLNGVRCFNGATADDCDMTFVDTGFRFTDGANPPNTINIGTQIGGKASNINPGSQTIALQAVRTGTTGSNTGACVGVFPDNTDVTVEMASQCNNPSTCITANKVSMTDSSTTPVTTAINNNPNTGVTSYSSVPLHFTTNSQAILNFVYPDVGQISLHARYNILDSSGAATDNYMSGNSNNFVVRPFAFYINVPTNPAAATAGGGAFKIAGNDFTVNVNAVLWQSEDDAGVSDGIADGHADTDLTNNANLSNNPVALNYGQEIAPNNNPATPTEQAVLSANLFLPNPGTNPGLDDSSANNNRITSFNSTTGIGSTTTVNYDEVGIIELHSNVSDNNYLGIGGPETAKIIGASSYVGRFIPDHFDTSVIEGCTVNNNYSYSGQPVSVTALARNVSGAATVNYKGTFAFDATITNAAVSPIINFTNNTIPAADFVDGIGTRTDVIYTFPAKDTPPALIIYRANDADTSPSIGSAEGTTEIRSGRIRLENAFGSELLPLTIPIRAEYFSDNGTAAITDDGYILNSDDSCSAYDAATATLANYTGNLTTVAATGTGSLASGIAGITLHLSGDVTLGPGVDNEGSVNLLLDAASWLEYNWAIDCDGDAINDTDPCGIASFGLYRGDDRIIYWREVF